MARISPNLQLSPSEIDAILGQESRLRIATVGANGQMNLTPMTFGWAGGKVYIFGRGQKVANLRRNPTATVLVDTGEQWRELKGIMLQGQARVLETAEEETADEHLAQAQLNLGGKHQLVRDGVTQPYTASATGRSRRWIVFSPETTVSWNNEKLS